jgi:TatA/E family protein of Tat protein translocase
MLDIGFQEILVLMVIALLVFGPDKLPDLGRRLGRAMREFRRASDEFRSTVETNLNLNDTEPYAPPAPAADAAVPASPAPEPVPATAPEPATAAIESGEPYVARRGAKLFHRRDCTWVSAIPELERVYLKRVAEAREQAFVECPACEPWEPS